MSNSINNEEGSNDGGEQGEEDSFAVGPMRTETDPLLPQPPSSHRRGHSDLSFFLGGLQNINQNQGKHKRQHHRRQSSVSRIVDNVSLGLGTIVEDVKFAAGNVKQTFFDELTDAHDGRTFFMDTQLTRSMSLRPDDLEQFVEETTGKSIQFPPLVALLAAVFAVSSHGTALSLQEGVPPPLKLYWRMSAVAMVLLFAVLIRRVPLPHLNSGQWATVAVAILCFVVQNLCFVIALSKTTIGNAVIFANSQAVLLLAGKILTGSQVLWMEAVGAIVASGGAIVCATSEHNHTDNEPANKESEALIGDLYALASAFCGVGYLTFAKSARSNTTVIMFTFLMMFGGSFLVLFFMVLAREKFTWSMNPHNGLFGWMDLTMDRLGLEIWIVLVCNLVGTMGFVRSLQYFDSIIIAVATLLEPMLASLIAYSMGVGEFPGIQGWTGNLLVALGTFSVVYPSIHSTEDSHGGH